MDGTLVDTESIHKEIYRELLKEHDKILTDDLFNSISGMANDNTWDIIAKETKLNIPKKILQKEFWKRAYERVGNCELMPGVGKLLLHLHSNNIPMAIASSTTQHMYARKSASHTELFKVFHHVVCGGSDPAVVENKPNPQIFIVCMDRFEDKPKPCDCLIFEDVLNGVRAAIKAGSQCVAIPPKQALKEDFKLATLILNSLEEFKPEQFALPKYN